MHQLKRVSSPVVMKIICKYTTVSKYTIRLTALKIFYEAI